jgi:hypothetical protein
VTQYMQRLCQRIEPAIQCWESERGFQKHNDLQGDWMMVAGRCLQKQQDLRPTLEMIALVDSGYSK